MYVNVQLDTSKVKMFSLKGTKRCIASEIESRVKNSLQCDKNIRKLYSRIQVAKNVLKSENNARKLCNQMSGQIYFLSNKNVSKLCNGIQCDFFV